MTTALAGILLLLCSSSAATAAEEPGWTWIHGTLADETEQAEYMAFARKIFDFYQKQSAMKGRLVGESGLKALPKGRIIFLGPLSAFSHHDWFGLPMKIESDGKVVISGKAFADRRTGIFLRNRENTRIAFTGLSLAGFCDLFTVRTGTRACTVTSGRREILIEGDFRTRGLQLDGEPLLDRYPSARDLEDLALPDGAITVKSVAAGSAPDGLAPEFRSWLSGFVKGQEVLFIGESHWNAGINSLFNRIVRELLAGGRLRAVFLEINYSFSGYYNHYISEASDEKAHLFLKSTLHPMVAWESVVDLLEVLRTWNRDHPGRQVRIACLDMEWYPEIVLDKIIVPYFRRVDSGFSLPAFNTLRSKGWKEERDRIDSLLAAAREKGIKGGHPFLTPAYMERVMTSFWDMAAHDNSMGNRQRTIIRNVAEFSGDLLGDGLVLFKGGGYHAVKRRIDGEDFYREAAYLDQVHRSTRGKVKTLMLNGLAFSLEETVGVDLKERRPSATNYNHFVMDFQKELAAGSASADGYYLFDKGGLTLFESLAAKIGYQSNLDVYRIQSVDWPRLMALHGEDVRQSRVHDYDAFIYVLRSELEVPRPRVIEKE